MKILKKINDKKILVIFTFLIIVYIPILKQLSFYLVNYNILSNYDSINPAIVLYISIPFLIYIYISDLIKTKRKLDIYDYLFYFLVIAGLIATVFSIDKNIALFGKVYRHEGFFTVLTYNLLFITWKVKGKKEDIKWFLKLLVIMAIINSIYSLLQIYTDYNFILRFNKAGDMASGISGNPNFLGSLIVTVISIVTLKFLMNKKVSFKLIPLIILLFITLINSQSTGPILAYLMTMAFIVVYLFIKRKFPIKKAIGLTVVFLIAFSVIFFANKEVFKKEKCEVCDFTNTITNNTDKVNDNYTITTNRLKIWKNSLEIVENNFINGVGYDNFYLEYYKDVDINEVTISVEDGKVKRTPKYKKIVDNAHNVYLHTFISTGIIGLIPYLLLCLFTFIKGLRTKNKLVMLLFAGFVGYSIQAFGNINVIQVAPIYYVIIGLILSIKQ